jgi:hypothetical protein
MRNWTGIQANRADITPHKLVQAIGLSYRAMGQVTRRSGLTLIVIVTNGGQSLGSLRSAAGKSWLMIVSSAGVVYAHQLGGGAGTLSLETGYTVDSPVQFLTYGTRSYWENDYAIMQVWDGVSSAARDAGIPAPVGGIGSPTVNTGGTLTPGNHLVRYRYIDSQSPGSLYRSNPSYARVAIAANAVTATGVPVMNGGSVTAVTMSNMGESYTTAPAVSFTTSPGTTATGTAVLGYQVTSLTVTTGTGYTSAPSVGFTGGSSGGNVIIPAQAVAVLDAQGNLIDIVLTSGGQGYNSAPTVVLTGGGGTGGAATANIGLAVVQYVEITVQGAGYLVPPTITIGAPTNSYQTFDFSVGSSAANIITPAAGWPDTIQIEMTAAGGSQFYVVDSFTWAGISTRLIGMPDSSVVELPSASLYGDYGHEQPPAAALMCEAQNVVFIGGYVPRSAIGTFVNNSASVTSVSPAPSVNWIGRFIQRSGDTAVYTIANISGTTLTLSVVYAGASGGAVAFNYAPKNPNRIYWSFQGLPESFYATVRARDVLANTGDQLKAIVNYLGDVWLFGYKTIQRLIFTNDPTTGYFVQVSTDHGVWNQACIVKIDSFLYGFGPNGVWLGMGGRAFHISQDVDWLLQKDPVYALQAAYAPFFHAAYDPEQRCIRFFFVAVGKTLPYHAMTYHIDTKVWCIDQYRVPITSSCNLVDDLSKYRMVIGDSTDGNLSYHFGATDNVPSVFPGVCTVASAASASVFSTNEALPTSPSLAPTTVYRLTTGETAVVSSNTGSTITLVTALSTTPSAGETFYCGSIPVQITTEWFTVDGTGEDKQRPYLLLFFNPSATGQCTIQVFKDFSTTPMTWTANPDDIPPDGVSIITGANYVTVQFSAGNEAGFISIPMFGDWARTWQATLTVTDPAGTFLLYDIKWALENRKQAITDIFE